MNKVFRLDVASPLVRRLFIAAIVQIVVVVAIALVIALFTMPDFSNSPHTHRPRHVARSHEHHPKPSFRLPMGALLTLLLIAGLILLNSLLVGFWLVRPITSLNEAVLKVAQGDFDVHVDIERRDELGELAIAFNEMTHKINKMITSERRLLADMSHELRTPLARLRVALELIEEGDADIIRHVLEGVTQDMLEMEMLIDDIFTEARLQNVISSDLVLLSHHTTEMQPGALVEHAIQRFGSRYPEREVIVHCDSSLPAVRIHPILMRRALENLLENAHKYSPDPDTAIFVQAVLIDAQVCIEVRDRGLGISKEDQEKLFEPFFRGDATKQARAGVGLGLSLVNRIVCAHQARLNVQSGAEGTAVQLYF